MKIFFTAILSFFTAILSFLLLMTTTEAAKVDAYRDILSNGRFTLKYTIIEPPVRVTNKEAKLIDKGKFGESFEIIDTGVAQYSSCKEIMVFDGNNKYFKSRNISVLKKNGENFRFASYQEGDKKYYRSLRYKHDIFANDEEELGIINAVDVLNEDYSYGMLTTALSPMISPDKIIATPYTPEYKFIGSGSLGNGLSYEDFFGSKNGFNCAIRYYFDGDTLSKIAVFDYVMKDSRIQTYEKYLVQIDEFSATPDQSYLTLPEGLKDKTNRDKGAKK